MADAASRLCGPRGAGSKSNYWSDCIESDPSAHYKLQPFDPGKAEQKGSEVSDNIEESPFSLDVLLHRQLSAVTFVQDYLQLDFDGKRLTVYAWPAVSLCDSRFTVDDNGYKDALCAFIAKPVTKTTETESEIVLAFDCGSITIDLVEDLGMEHLVYDDTVSNTWAWW